MRLLLDIQGAQGGSRNSGLGRYSLELARALAATRGRHEVLLLLNGLMADSADALQAEFAPLLGLGAIHRFTPPESCAAGSNPHHPARLLAEQIRAQAILAREPDMVHVGSLFEGWNEPLVTTWPEAMGGPRMVATLHDLIPLSRPAEYLDGAWREAGLVPWYMRHLAALRGMDGLLCNSGATLAEGAAMAGIEAGRLCPIGGGVASHFRPDRGKPPLPGRYLLCLGLNDARKNEARLIEAMALLPAALRKGLTLAVTGTAPAVKLARLAARAGLAEGTIRHLGTVPDAAMPALYSHAALFVLPSLAEGFGLPLAEAMACGAPFCASRVGALPEVAGRDDVLFDPLNVADMARVMGAILGDAGLAEALRRYGPAEATRHSWPDAARRAWAAMERWSGPPRLARPTLAVTGPVPPQPSGIAEYSAELLPELAAHYAITVVSDAPPTRGPVAGMAWVTPAEFARHPYAFDRVLHQLGNAAVHHEQHTTLLQLRPAVTVLHDVALPEYRQWAAQQGGQPLTEAIYRNHGYPGLLAALAGSPAQVAASLPMSAEVLEQSLAVLVHSDAAAGILRDCYGATLTSAVQVVPHLRCLPPSPDPCRDRATVRARLGLPPFGLVVTSFGACVPKKLPVRLVESFAAAALQGATLVFAGALQAGLADVLRAAARACRLPPVALVLTGGLDRAVYEDWLAATDIAVQLRGAHQGETSGALADAMAAGLACIANIRGSMAELPPDAARLLPEDFTDAELAAALAGLAAGPEERRSLGQAARRWVAAQLDPAGIALRYRDTIERAHRAPLAAVLAAAARIPSPGAGLAAQLARALAASFPSLRQGRLYLDEAAGWDRTQFAAMHATLRPEPARWQGEGWQEAHRALSERFDMEQPAAPDRPVRFQPGDMLVTAGKHPVPPGIRRVASLTPPA